MGQPPVLVREVQRVGELVLPGDGTSKLFLAQLPPLNELLKEDFKGLIEERAAAGPTSADIIKHLVSITWL